MDTPTRQARTVFLAALVGIIMISTVGGAVTESGKARQPRNIYGLIYSMEVTFGSVLQADELKQYRTMSPKELRKKNPALYERISGDVKGWTDAWLRDALAHGDQISEKRLSEGEHIVKQIDPILRSYFEAKKWPYRPMKVIFLPPRLLQDERHRENITSGMFIPYYPDAFFATVDWPIRARCARTSNSTAMQSSPSTTQVPRPALLSLPVSSQICRAAWAISFSLTI